MIIVLVLFLRIARLRLLLMLHPYDDYHQIDLDKLKFGEWLQLGDGEEDRRGYFVYYQNAQTGEMILNTDNCILKLLFNLPLASEN